MTFQLKRKKELKILEDSPCELEPPALCELGTLAICGLDLPELPSGMSFTSAENGSSEVASEHL